MYEIVIYEDGKEILRVKTESGNIVHKAIEHLVGWLLELSKEVSGDR